MKKLFSVLFVCIILSSCSVVMHSKFTNVDTLLNVNRGDSFDAVVQKIGFLPENIYVQQTTGYKMVVYNYKIKQRLVNPQIINLPGSEKNGSEKYAGKLHKVYFMFDKNDQLISYITDSGRDDGHNVLANDEKILNFKDFMKTEKKKKSTNSNNKIDSKKSKKGNKLQNPLL